MLIGVIGAVYFYNSHRLFTYVCTHKLTQTMAWIAIGMIAFNRFHIASVIDQEIISVITVFLIMGQITEKKRLISLENTVFDFLGKISYGIYVIHPLVIFILSKIMTGSRSGGFIDYFWVYTLNITISIIAAFVSYELLEKRFLKLKAKYTITKSSSTKSCLT